MRPLLRLTVLGIALLSTGCYRLTIVNGRQVHPTPVVEDRWRSATILDVFPIDTPVRADLECGERGWAKIYLSHSFTNWLADVFLAGGLVYESTHLDVYCARPAPFSTPPSGAAPLAAPPPAPTNL